MARKYEWNEDRLFVDDSPNPVAQVVVYYVTDHESKKYYKEYAWDIFLKGQWRNETETRKILGSELLYSKYATEAEARAVAETLVRHYDLRAL